MPDTFRLRYDDPASDEARCWRRIECERPETWLEANAVAGRREVFDEILHRLGDVRGRRIVDLGCGRGSLLRRLAEAGACSTGIDRRREALAALRTEGGPAIDLCEGVLPRALEERASAGERFDDVVAVELFEEFPASSWPDLARAIEGVRPQRLIVAARVPGLGSAVLAASGWPGPRETIDLVPLLRTLHLETGLRLVDRTTVSHRTYRAEIVELRRPAAEGDR